MLGLFWVAPEYLRGTAEVTDASSQQAADVYAVAIIIKEIFARNGPYSEQQDIFGYDPEGTTTTRYFQGKFCLSDVNNTKK